MSRKTSVFILVWGYDDMTKMRFVQTIRTMLSRNMWNYWLIVELCAADELNWFRIENTEHFKWTEHFWIVLYPNNEVSQKNIRRDVEPNWKNKSLAIFAHPSSAPIIDWHYNKYN